MNELGAWFNGLGILGALGMGLSRRREPKTKTEAAWAQSQRLSDLTRDLESMMTDGQCLLGTDAQGTLSPFNAEVNAVIGEIVLLRRRAMLAKAKIHAIAFPKLKQSVTRLTAEVGAAEKAIDTILAMPDLSPEEELANKHKNLVVQALSIPGEAHALDAIVKATSLSPDQVRVAVESLVAAKFIEAHGDGFKLTKIDEEDEED